MTWHIFIVGIIITCYAYLCVENYEHGRHYERLLCKEEMEQKVYDYCDGLVIQYADGSYLCAPWLETN